MIVRREHERRIVEQVIEQVTCSRCGRDVTKVHETADGSGKWDGAFLTGVLHPLSGFTTETVEIAWEFCAGCLNELRQWVGNDGDPTRGGVK